MVQVYSSVFQSLQNRNPITIYHFVHVDIDQVLCVLDALCCLTVTMDMSAAPMGTAGLPFGLIPPQPPKAAVLVRTISTAQGESPLNSIRHENNACRSPALFNDGHKNLKCAHQNIQFNLLRRNVQFKYRVCLFVHLFLALRFK